ncbi:hypothetical protein WN944_000048 [Citrus x changshan-huyou]|uniref:Uncharacterized protein n=1 Tax=Citrus x changshan-huyou TaxID=2935761 RepID=A0AAP0QPA8_9ROSI
MPNKALHEKKRGQCSQGQLAGKLKMYKQLRQVILGCVVQLSASSGKTLLTNNGKMIFRPPASHPWLHHTLYLFMQDFTARQRLLHAFLLNDANDADLIAGTNGKGTGPLPSNLDGSNFSGSGYSGFLCVAYTADVM